MPNREPINEFPTWTVSNESMWGMRTTMPLDNNPYRIAKGDVENTYPYLVRFLSAKHPLASFEAAMVIAGFINNEEIFAEVFVHMQRTDPMWYFTDDNIFSVQHRLNIVNIGHNRNNRHWEPIFDKQLTSELGEVWLRRHLYANLRDRINQFMEPYGLYRNEYDYLKNVYADYRMRTGWNGIFHTQERAGLFYPEGTQQHYYLGMFAQILQRRSTAFQLNDTLATMEQEFRQSRRLYLGSKAGDYDSEWVYRRQLYLREGYVNPVDWDEIGRYIINSPCVWAQHWQDGEKISSRLIVLNQLALPQVIKPEDTKTTCQHLWAKAIANVVKTTRVDSVSDAATNYSFNSSDNFGNLSGFEFRLKDGERMSFLVGFTVDGTPDKTALFGDLNIPYDTLSSYLRS